MSSFNNIAEVEAIFGVLQLSPIEKGMNDVQVAKERFAWPPMVPHGTQYHRVVLTNGTGSTNRDTYKNAELERGTS